MAFEWSPWQIFLTSLTAVLTSVKCSSLSQNLNQIVQFHVVWTLPFDCLAPAWICRLSLRRLVRIWRFWLRFQLRLLKKNNSYSGFVDSDSESNTESLKTSGNIDFRLPEIFGFEAFDSSFDSNSGSTWRQFSIDFDTGFSGCVDFDSHSGSSKDAVSPTPTWNCPCRCWQIYSRRSHNLHAIAHDVPNDCASYVIFKLKIGATAVQQTREAS